MAEPVDDPQPQVEFDLSQARQELLERGWTVVPSVVSHEDCDRWMYGVRDWLAKFKDGRFPNNINSLIHGYSSGHLEPVWQARLRVKPLFAQLWGTEKLLTSMDGIAVGRPPELSEEQFEPDPNIGLHCDQKPRRRGLHAYQGALYLEAQEENDWCFKVIDGSHKHHADFFRLCGGRSRSEFRKLNEEDVKWYASRGCEVRRVAVSKGGLMLWDSRLIHAGARPLEGREHRDRWRYIFFICQTPAIWASAEDLQIKRAAYEELLLTKHWPSQGVDCFRNRRATTQDVKSLPTSARCEDARLLAGVDSYNFSDGGSNGPKSQPKWD